MALFSKSAPKKPGAADPNARAPRSPAPAPQSTGARDASGRAGESPSVTITGFGAFDRLPTRRQIEVTQGQPGMGAVLENAVLLYASGHADQALTFLSRGIQDDEEAKVSQFAWLTLFDLLQRAGNRVAFEQLTMLYVVRFECSAPAWNEQVKPTAGSRATAGAYVAMTGKLSAASGAQLEVLKRAIRGDSQTRFDLTGVVDFDDAGARALASVLAEARRRQHPLQTQRSEGLRQSLEAAVRSGRASGEGAWLLSMELMQWENDRTAFDDRAVDYAVTFEVSPPSWEPPTARSSELEQAAEATAAMAALDKADSAVLGTDMLAWSGVLTGSNAPQISMLAGFAHQRDVVAIDMREVERIDFVSAGAFLNWIGKLENQQKVVQIHGASPIIRGILLLIGVPPGQFVQKAQ